MNSDNGNLPLIIGVDIGTSSVKAIAYTADGAQVAEGRAKLSVFYKGRHAEQQPGNWWSGTVQAVKNLSELLGDRRRKVTAIGLTGQCPTFALMKSGEEPDIGWLYQDNRAVDEAEQIIRRFGKKAIHRRTGQLPSPFYLAPKLLWLKNNNHPGFRSGASVIQPRDYVGWKFTGCLVTDPSHAACSLMYDIQKNNWAQDWIAELGLDTLHWPDLAPSCSVLGTLTAEAARAVGLAQGIPVAVGAADSICACFGAIDERSGILCDVAGTSTCLHLLLDEQLVIDGLNIYPYVEPGRFCAETGLNTTGAALQWLADLFQASHQDLLEEAERSVAGEPLFFPYLSGGERDNPDRTGGFVGLNLAHSRGQLTRSVLEGVAFAMKERIETITKAGIAISEVVSCGGGNRSDLWNQIKADVLRLPLHSIDPYDTTARGAAMTAARAIGDHSGSMRNLKYRTYKPCRSYVHAYASFIGKAKQMHLSPITIEE